VAGLTHALHMSQSSLEDNNPAARGTKRRQESRRRLLEVARRMFVERGYHATRPQDITKAAGLGHGTFYLHFKDKQDCFMAFIEQAQAEIDAAIIDRAASAKSLPEMVEAVLVSIYDYAENHPGVLMAAMNAETVVPADKLGGGTLLQRWGEKWGELLKTQAKQGLVAKDFDFVIIGQAIVGAIHQASSFSFERGRSRASLVKALTQFIVRALTPRK